MNSIEVFSFDGNKTFGYDIQLDVFSIRKMNKNIEFINNNLKSKAIVNEKQKLKYDLSSNFFKSLHGTLLCSKYVNKKESKILFLSFITCLDEFFKNNSLNSTFSSFDESLNLLLDKQEIADFDVVQVEIDLNKKALADYLFPLLSQHIHHENHLDVFQ